jgi:hypothetical protein
MRGGTNDNGLWMKTIGMSHALLSAVYAQNNTARCYCGTGVMSKKVAGKKNNNKISAGDIVRFLTHFSVSRAIKDYIGSWILARVQL